MYSCTANIEDKLPTIVIPIVKGALLHYRKCAQDALRRVSTAPSMFALLCSSFTIFQEHSNDSPAL